MVYGTFLALLQQTLLVVGEPVRNTDARKSRGDRIDLVELWNTGLLLCYLFWFK